MICPGGVFDFSIGRVAVGNTMALSGVGDLNNPGGVFVGVLIRPGGVFVFSDDEAVGATGVRDGTGIADAPLAGFVAVRTLGGTADGLELPGPSTRVEVGSTNRVALGVGVGGVCDNVCTSARRALPT